MKNSLGVSNPTILKLANNLCPNDETIELYTNETSTEFHTLLVNILALNKLTTYNQEKAKTEDRLLRLSRGQTFQLHLKTFNPSLWIPFV